MIFMWLSHTWVLHPECTSHSTPDIPWNDTTTPYLRDREKQLCPRRCIGSTFESVCCGTCFTSPCLFYFSVWAPYHCFREKRIFNPLSILASFFSQIWVFRVWAYCRYVLRPMSIYTTTNNKRQTTQVRSRDLVIRIAMNVSLLMIVIRLIFEIVRVMSDLGENSDETFLISSQSRSFDALQLDLSVFVVSLLHTTFFQFVPRPAEPPRVLSMRLVAYVL